MAGRKCPRRAGAPSLRGGRDRTGRWRPLRQVSPQSAGWRSGFVPLPIPFFRQVGPIRRAETVPAGSQAKLMQGTRVDATTGPGPDWAMRTSLAALPRAGA